MLKRGPAFSAEVAAYVRIHVQVRQAFLLTLKAQQNIFIITHCVAR